MSDTSLFFSVLLMPLMVGILLFILKGKTAYYVALSSSIITLIATLILYNQFSPVKLGFQFDYNYPWLQNTHANFSFGVDGLSMLMLILTNLLLPFIIYSSKEDKRPSKFYALILLMQFGLLGVFSVTDGLLFYLFWEITLLPIWFLCGIFGKGKNKQRVFIKFFIYTFVGSLFMLIGLMYLYHFTPDNRSFHYYALFRAVLDAKQQLVVFWLFFIAFAIKLPLIPFHTWQPNTYKMAPTQGSMLLSGIMLKMAIYGIIRFLLPITPLAISGWSGELVLILAISGIVYASIIAITRKDIKKIIAYSSIAHVGLIVAGIFAAARTPKVLGLNMEAIQGVGLQSLAHGINVVALFYAADILSKKFNTTMINQMGGLAKKAPVFAALFFIICAGSMAVPLTNGFIGEFLLLKGLFNYNTIAAIIAGTTVILCAVYMLRLYNESMFGKLKKSHENIKPISASQTIGLGGLAILILLFGLFPQSILDLTHDSLEFILKGFNN